MNRKFRSIEILIFLLVLGVFGRSSYVLISNYKGEPVTESVAVANVTREVATSSKSEENDFQTVAISCDRPNLNLNIKATKVRFTGSFCGQLRRPASKAITPETPPQISVENQTQTYVATIFSDPVEGKFSTDFIPLGDGSNLIVMKFSYPNRAESLEINLNRTDSK